MARDMIVSGKIMILAGGIVLLISWLLQNVLFQKWDDDLSDIEQARSVFTSYESTNSLFNSIYLIAAPDQKNMIRSYQIANYRDGLSMLVPFLSDQARESIAIAIDEQEADPGDLSRVQREIDQVLSQFEVKEKRVDQLRNRALLWVSGFYVLGAGLAIAGEMRRD